MTELRRDKERRKERGRNYVVGESISKGIGKERRGYTRGIKLFIGE